jgi:hypothetical protein
VTEWYVNGPLGLEQGFTFRKPGAGERLTVTQTLAASARPHLSGQTLMFGEHGAVLHYGDLHAFDATKRELPARMALVGHTLVLTVDAGKARYPVTIDPLIQEGSKVTPDAGEESGSGQFGWSVSLSTDGNTALVGAPHDSGGVPGAAWIFTRNGVGWTEAAKLAPGDPTGVSLFGGSVALSGDGTTALVGAPGGASGGTVWFFTVNPNNGSWSQAQELATPGDAITAPDFGYSVAVSQNGGTAIVGGNTDNNGSGAAWIFSRGQSGFTEMKKLTALDTTGAQFGYSVALSADGSTALVGGPYAKWPERRRVALLRRRLPGLDDADGDEQR